MAQDRVFVLGAGMSVGAGIPAMNTLTRLLFTGRYNLGLNDFVGSFTHFAFPGIDMRADDDGVICAGPSFKLNLEDLMTIIDAYMAFTSHAATTADIKFSMEDLRQLLYKMIGRCINDLSNSTPIPDYYQAFVRSLAPSDVVITFNWDTLLERACEEAGLRWGFLQCSVNSGDLDVIYDPDIVTVVKLHGSVDWRETGDLQSGDTILFSRDDKPVIVARSGKLDSEAPRLLAESMAGAPYRNVPWLVPPAHFKTFEWRGLGGALWNFALRALISSGETTVIGYSMPITDYMSQWLFRVGVLRNHRTGREFVKAFMEPMSDEDYEDEFADEGQKFQAFRRLFVGATEEQNHVLMKQWDKSVVPLTIVNPDPSAADRFRQLVTKNISYHECTAEEFFLDADRYSGGRGAA